MIKEIWKDIKGYEGLYQVSNLGRVKNLARFVKQWRGGQKPVRERILKLNKHGKYFSIMLGRYGKTELIHRLVAQAFLSNSRNKRCVNHLDGDPSNNKINNLAWCSYQENERHSYDVLGKKIWNRKFTEGRFCEKD